ncbi:MAG: hypothetical protein ACXAEU_08900 [Candidatus Hodarchaeales archaeon]|jgi:RPA family protein
MESKDTAIRRGRSPAKRIRIGWLKTVEYMQADQMNMHLPVLNGERLYRVHILGTLTRKTTENNLTDLLVDDGTGSLHLKTSDPELSEYHPWQQVDVTGIIRVEYGEDLKIKGIFVDPEIIIPVENLNWELLHRIEILKDRKSTKILATEHPTASGNGFPIEADLSTDETSDKQDMVTGSDLQSNLVAFFEGKGTGTGVNYKEIKQNFNDVEEEDLIDTLTELMSEGVIFEPKPNLFKYLG